LFRGLGSTEKSSFMSKSGIQALSACRRQRDSTGARLALDWLRVALYALLHGLNADAAARCHPGAGLDHGWYATSK
jgi:hypothetical protein